MDKVRYRISTATGQPLIKYIKYKMSSYVSINIKSIILLMLLFCILCSKDGDRPSSGGEIRIGWTTGLVGVDPIKDWGCAGAMKILQLVFSHLYISENNPLQIASKVSASEDYQEWTFVLKKNCYFHNDPCFSNNTRLINAYDVKYTYDRAKRTWVDLEPVENIREVIVLDSFSVKILLKNPDANFTDKISWEFLYIVPCEAVEKYGDNFGFHPVGSGPFCFQSWDKKELILTKNRNFWAKDKCGQRLPYLDKVTIVFFPDANQCASELFNGKIDLSPITADAAEISFIREGKEIVLKEEYADRFQVVQCPFPHLTVLLFNCRDNPIFRNPDLRKAFNYAINREELKSLLFMPRIQFASGPSLCNVSGFKYEYDLKKAKEYLKKAGYPEGLQDLVFQYYPSPFSRELIEVLQRQLKVLNIKTKLSCASRPRVLRESSPWDLGVVTIAYQDSTPASQLSIYYSGSAPWVEFSSPVFDSLWRLYNSKAPEDRVLIAQLDSLVFEDPPFVYLYWCYPIFFADKRLMELDPIFLVSPYTWWKYE